MDEMNQFEHLLEERVRAFAIRGIQPVDSAAVARSVVGGRTGRRPTRFSGRWFDLPLDRRAWSILLASSIVVLAVVLLPRLQSGWEVGTSPEPTRTPTPSVTESPEPRLGLAYALDGDIYVANSDGTNSIRIADGATDTECGAFWSSRGLVSPDGRLIAYRSRWFQDCPGTVHISDPAGNLVASFPGVGWDIGWSPDSAHLATWLEEDETIGIYTVGGVLENILNETRMCCGDYDPIWSPDGAAAVLIKEAGFGGAVFGAVWELPIDGGTPVRVPPEDPRSVLGRGWSQTMAYAPDRTRVALIDSNSMHIVAADGTLLKVVLDASSNLVAGSARWSPRGELIAYVETHILTYDEDGSEGERSNVIRFVDPRSGTMTASATVPGRVGLSLIGFSPDGDRLLFSQDEEDGNSSLWVVNADGSGARMLVEGTSDGDWGRLPDAPAAP